MESKKSSTPAPGNKELSRRKVLQGAAAALASVTVVPRSILGGPGAPSERLNLAGVGVGGVGFGQVGACERAGFNITALCDVDEVYAGNAFKKWPRARRYRDFREMLEAEGDKIDAVYCGTPDHNHAIVTMPALRKKKHVCCVKPLTRTIGECRTVVRKAVEVGVATQVTASANTSDGACRTCELIWGGAIGPVREVHIWSNRPLWPQGMLRPKGEDPVPRTFDWKLWLGPAPVRPFKAEWPGDSLVLKQLKAGGGQRAVYHPWNFRGWWQFGTGALGDMGCHHLNTPYRALKLKYPTSVYASATKVFEETAPLASIVTYDFPAREDMPPVRIVWYDGGLKPVCPKGLKGLPAEGNMYVGDHGVMLGSNVVVSSGGKNPRDIPRTLPRRSGTWGEWMESCRGGEKGNCHFEVAGLLTEFVLLGNIAIRNGKYLEWDGPNMRFTNDKDANRYINPPYHNGWTLEA